MIHSVNGFSIRGVACAVPRTIIFNDIHRELADVIKMTGVRERRVAPANDNTSITRFAVEAAQPLLGRLGWGRDVDAVICVTQTPDRRAPSTACLIQHALGLFPSVAAFDVNLGCSGFTYGLWLMARLLGEGQRGLLVTGDLTRRYVDFDDRATGHLFGDCVAVTAVDRATIPAPAVFVLGTDGGGADSLTIPATAPIVPVHYTRLRMVGPVVFQFTLEKVPQMYRSLYEPPTQQPDHVLLHQANAMIVKQLSKRMPSERGAPCNIERWGNTSSSSIPLLMHEALGHSLRTERLRLGLFGYGIGLSWAGIDLHAGPNVESLLVEV